MKNIKLSFLVEQGFIILNDHNLGRYWPIAGPQITLYVPKEFLRKHDNSIVVVEMQRAPANRELKFSQHSIIRYRSDKKLIHKNEKETNKHSARD